MAARTLPRLLSVLFVAAILVAGAQFASSHAASADGPHADDSSPPFTVRESGSLPVRVRVTPLPGLMVGDVNVDGQTNIIDAMFVAQHTVGLRMLDIDQLQAGDTTADGVVNIVDAMHIAQFSVDPTGSGDVLFKPLYDHEFHQSMFDPLTIVG